MRAVEIGIGHVAGNSIQVAIDVGGDRFNVSFRSSVPLFVERSDALVPLGLIAAMGTRAGLVVNGAVSPLLLQNSDTAQTILEAFSDGELVRTSLTADPAHELGAPGAGTGVFFSGGVDSMYSLLKHQETITHLVFMSGYDTYEIGSARDLAGIECARRVADAFGKELVEIETDVTYYTDAHASWKVAHGPLLGVVALMLQSQFRRMLIPSGQAYRDLFPLCTHPLLDPLWGTEAMDIVHDGCERTRVGKVAAIANSDVALGNLRVCNKQHARLNCGVCEKCVRTMVSLRLAGALDRCTTFPSTLRLRRVATVQAPGSKGRANWRAPVEAARRNRDWSLLAALAWARRPRPLLPLRHGLGRIRRALSR